MMRYVRTHPDKGADRTARETSVENYHTSLANGTVSLSICYPRTETAAQVRREPQQARIDMVLVVHVAQCALHCITSLVRRVVCEN